MDKDRRKILTLAALGLAGTAPGRGGAQPVPLHEGRGGARPQYIFFHITAARRTNPKQITADLLASIPETLGTRGNRKLMVGAAFSFSVLEQTGAELAEVLQRLFDASEEAQVPVFPCLDGQNWWESRPDLWNWWDPGRPGYNPENRANVEWFGWGPEYAVKIGWRNWGRQIRVAPAPNIESPAVLAEHDRAFRELVPLLARWHRSLAADRKYLFGGFKVGWEASINVNAYYYPGGNEIFDRSPTDASGDPNDHKSAHGWTFRHQPIGFNAAFTAGVKRSGELTKDDIEAVVRRYLERLARTANECGIPKELIFTHQGGTYAPWDRHLTFRAAINDFSVPGWSFYSHDPPECGSMASDMESAKREEWGAVEWLRRGPDAAAWRSHFERTLGFKKCRLISVYNWEGVRSIEALREALRTVVSARAE